METSVKAEWIIVCMVSALFLSQVRGQTPHYMDVEVWVKTIQNQCVPYTYQSCKSSFWGLFKSCTTKTEQRCSDVLVDVKRTVRRCEAGYVEPDCIVPICNPACTNGQTCLSPNNCGCLKVGTGACSTVPCSGASLDCYPGTCTTAGNTCQCPTGFSGANCDQFQVKAKLSSCRVTLNAYSPQRAIADSPCYAENVTPIPVWVQLPTGGNSLTTFSVSWDSEVDAYSYQMPTVTYVSPSPFPMGVTQAQCSVSISGSVTKAVTGLCGVYDYQGYVWVGKKSCTASTTWTSLGIGNPSHGQTITFTAMSTTGGRKTVTLQGATNTKVISGQTATMTAQFIMDGSPPTHCLLQTPSGDGCSCFPIYLAKDITASDVIRPIMCGWSDDGSGLDRFKVDVFYLSPDVNGRLAETGPRLSISDDNVSPLNNDYYFTLPKSGVYSIQLTVYDKANNSARARKILNYDGDSKWTIDDTAKVYLADAAASTGYQWINALDVPRDGQYYYLTVVWTGRYKSDVRYSAAWRQAVVPWAGCTASNNCIDDRPPEAYNPQQPLFFGLRSMAALPDVTGILGYGLSYVVDAQGGRGLTIPPSYTYYNATAKSATIAVSAQNFTNGKSLVLWFTASDVAGNEENIRFVVGLDRTPADVSLGEFKQNTFDKYKWSLTFPVVDNESGIKSVSYVIYDASLKANVTSGSSNFDAVDQQQCGADCYCIPTGGCFSNSLQVDVDNCNFDKYIADPLLMWYTVTNGAGLRITKELKLSNLNDVLCRPVPGPSAGAYVGIAIGILVFVLLAVLIALLVWRWVVHKDTPTQSARKLYQRTFRVKRETENHIYSQAGEAQVDAPNNANTRAVPTVPATASHDEEYGISDNVTSRVLTARDVTTGNVLADGKFAVVMTGTARIDSRKVDVAVKALKPGFNSGDSQLMKDKIAYLASIAPHVNIVQLIGSYDGGMDGPVMVLELCELPLKDYLEGINRTGLSTEYLENMLLFASNIATGVEYLHSKNIIHRRLGVRNVLLKKHLSGYVAKLIGFGPSASEEGALPLRWLPLETLDTQNTGNPTFNTKTDSWSYGVTVWEIYSKGAKPYPRHETKEVHGLLKRGYRMDCPAVCPPEIWQQVVIPCWDNKPNSRPSFTNICKTIARFRSSGNGRGDYYTANDVNDPNETYCNM